MRANLVRYRFLGAANEQAADIEKNRIGTEFLFEVARSQGLDTLAQARQALRNRSHDERTQFVLATFWQFGNLRQQRSQVDRGELQRVPCPMIRYSRTAARSEATLS